MLTKRWADEDYAGRTARFHDLYLSMDKIPDEVWFIVAIVVAAKIGSMIDALLPYDPGDQYDANLMDD